LKRDRRAHYYCNPSSQNGSQDDGHQYFSIGQYLH